MSINRHEELSLLLRRSRLAGLLFLLSCLVVSSVAVREAGNSTLIIPRAVCPQVLRCHCSNGRDPTAVMCRQISHFEIYQLISLYPSLRSLEIDQWAEHTLNLEVLSKLTSLVDLSVKNSELREVIPVGQRWESLKVLDFGSSRLIETEILCNISRSIVHLNLLNLSRTKLFSLEMCLVDASIDVLDASNNELSNASLPQSLISLDLSGNQLEGLTLPDQTQNADISRNPLRNLGNGLLKKIRVLNITGTAFTVLPELDAPTLEEIHFDKNRLIFADLTRWRTPLLKTVSLRESSQLELVYGSLPPTVRHLKLTKADIEDLPREFFSSVNLTTLELESTAWDCHPCRLLWARSVQKQLDPTLCPGVSFNLSACQLGCLGTDSLRRVRYGMHAVLRCACWGDPDPSVEWSFYRPKTLLGRFDPGLNKAFTHDLGEFTRLRGRYEILSNGLLLHSAERDLVERYVCVVRNMHGSAYHVVSMRLDYSHWYSLDILDSVFWGCLLCSFLVCFLSFLLNITWILSRKSILWWIKRAERLSRVRKMVEAMEKYRARQMEALHETYTRRVHNVRENYHHQVEQLRQSYASQAERFRDYRAAQMENVTSHLETIRENYNQQMQRVREYGSRRAESLWESYERQVNRMRTFSLQHRLKLMRQYKVKQRYLNKLLESFQDPHNPEAIRQHEEEVRAALDELKDAPLDEPLSGKSVSSPTKTARTSTFVEAGHDPLSRASSYYSLPEYVLDENGQLRAPIIPNVRFHHREEFSSRPGPSNSNSAEPTPKRGPSSSLSSNSPQNHGTQKNEEVELRDFGIGNYGLDETLSRLDHPKDRKSAPTSLPL